MSALARYFHHKGKEVVGYDKTSTPLTDELIREGSVVSFVDDPNGLPVWLKSDGATSDYIVVYTPAIPIDHKEFNYIKSKGVRLWKRSEVLGEVTRGVRTIAVAGTHGKTTTSTMIAHLLKHANRNVTAFRFPSVTYAWPRLNKNDTKWGCIITKVAAIFCIVPIRRISREFPKLII